MFMPMYACHVRNTIGANHSNHSTSSFEIISDESFYISIVKKEKGQKKPSKTMDIFDLFSRLLNESRFDQLPFFKICKQMR